jgi:ABC-type multidrug transport system ATPase subunit
MEVRAGDVVGIVGDAGAGKTSLLAAIMGQLRHSAGEVRVHGSIAYVPAEPWLVNTTLKENIIFGMPYNERKYRAVIRACRLAPDISTFPHGDETEIGDRGANLTLPQRHRVSIARAAYSDASIILLDDPLSTMDGHIAKRIFNECISGYLRDKAIIMVTSQLHFLEHCNQVIVLSDGKCIEQGSYSELMAKNFNLANLVGDSIEIEDPYLVDDLVDVVAQDQPTNDQDISQNATQDGTQTPASQSDGSNQPQANTGPAITFAPVEHPGRSNDYSMSNGAGDNAARVSGNPRNYSSANPQSPLNDGNMHTFHGQMTLMGGTILGTIGHNNTWARALERNQLTIHSIHDLQGDDSDIFGRDSSNGSSWKAYRMFANRTTGIPISLAICVFFVVVQGLRIFSDFWLMHFAAEVAEIDEELEEERADTSDHYLSVYGITTVSTE